MLQNQNLDPSRQSTRRPLIDLQAAETRGVREESHLGQGQIDASCLAQTSARRRCAVRHWAVRNIRGRRETYFSAPETNGGERGHALGSYADHRVRTLALALTLVGALRASGWFVVKYA